MGFLLHWWMRSPNQVGAFPGEVQPPREEGISLGGAEAARRCSSTPHAAIIAVCTPTAIFSPLFADCAEQFVLLITAPLCSTCACPDTSRRGCPRSLERARRHQQQAPSVFASGEKIIIIKHLFLKKKTVVGLMFSAAFCPCPFLSQHPAASCSSSGARDGHEGGECRVLPRSLALHRYGCLTHFSSS